MYFVCSQMLIPTRLLLLIHCYFYTLYICFLLSSSVFCWNCEWYHSIRFKPKATLFQKKNPSELSKRKYGNRSIGCYNFRCIWIQYVSRVFVFLFDVFSIISLRMLLFLFHFSADYWYFLLRYFNWFSECCFSVAGKYTIFEGVKLLGNLTWGVAGRNETKLKDTLKEIGAKANDDLTGIPIIIADVNDEGSLQKMAERAKVFLNFASTIPKFNIDQIGKFTV